MLCTTSLSLLSIALRSEYGVRYGLYSIVPRWHVFGMAYKLGSEALASIL